jgi:hypothetical protein
VYCVPLLSNRFFRRIANGSVHRECRLMDPGKAELAFGPRRRAGSGRTEIPANRAADDDSRETLAVIERFRLLYRLILPPPFHQPDSAGERYATAQMAHLDSEKGGAH